MDRRSFVRAAGATALTSAIAGCSGGANDGGGATETPSEADGGEATATETETDAGTQTGTDDDLDVTLFDDEREIPEGLEITASSLQQTADGAEVTGTLENGGEQTYEEIEVQVTLLDGDEGPVGRFFANTEDTEFDPPFEPGDTWEFTVSMPSADVDQATQYRIDVDAKVDEVVDIDIGGDGTDTATGTSNETGTGTGTSTEASTGTGTDNGTSTGAGTTTGTETSG